MLDCIAFIIRFFVSALPVPAKLKGSELKLSEEFLTIAGVGPPLALDEHHQGGLQAVPLLALVRGYRRGF